MNWPFETDKGMMQPFKTAMNKPVQVDHYDVTPKVCLCKEGK